VGAGKTLATCAIAATLFEKDEIDRVVVIAPRSEVVNQWAADFARVTGRHMNKATGADRELHAKPAATPFRRAEGASTLVPIAAD
jgi:superfamily II DNA or RNA helicase